MKDIQQQKVKKWIKSWQNASAALRQVKKDELRACDYYQKNLALLDGMLTYACENGTVRIGSGLVEQQRLFGKLNNSDTLKQRT